MKTLKNIHEGFFSNVGATGALYKNKVIEYLENIKNVNTKSLYIREMSRYTLEEAIKEVKTAPDDWFNNGLGDLLSTRRNANEIHNLRYLFARRLIISADVFDPKLTTLPNWFKLDDFASFYKNVYGNAEELTVYIGNMPNLDPKEVINLLKNFNLIKGIVIVDCPKFKDFEGLPKKIGQDGLVFKPSPNAKFRYRDILKYFRLPFPMTSFRLKNMTTDNIVNLERTYKIAPNPPYERIEAIKETLKWMERTEQ